MAFRPLGISVGSAFEFTLASDTEREPLGNNEWSRGLAVLSHAADSSE